MTDIDEARRRAERDATRNRMYLCPDPKMLEDLLEGLVENEERYGYPSCPCRMATGELEKDIDIICPCYYRDPDVEEYGQCYCSLYVSKAVKEGEEPIRSIPERRPIEKQVASLGIEEEYKEEKRVSPEDALRHDIQTTDRRMLYCKQCGYMIYRDDPPYRCPICQAKQEMFAEVVIMGDAKSRDLF